MLPQHALLAKISNLKCTRYVFQRNYEDLIILLDSIEKPEVALPLCDIHARKSLTIVLFEISRLLHNFLSSAKTLIDHTRVFIKDQYLDRPFLNEFRKEVENRFSNQGEQAFIQRFRNYCLHQKLTFIESSLDLGHVNDPNIKHSIHLDKARLLKWDGWNKPAKEFLNKQKDKIDLKLLLITYFHLIDDFYQWLDKRFIDIHKNEINELETQRKTIYQQMEAKGLTDFD